MIKETDSNAIPSGTLLTILSQMFHLILKVNSTKKDPGWKQMAPRYPQNLPKLFMDEHHQITEVLSQADGLRSEPFEPVIPVLQTARR
ncbi:hypothetical protein QL285_010096 [Trifolium repens]|nr:hypothetical protein QL285_010096 [Trifolium repens]